LFLCPDFAAAAAAAAIVVVVVGGGGGRRGGGVDAVEVARELDVAGSYFGA
jgi:hypothetical protein